MDKRRAAARQALAIEVNGEKLDAIAKEVAALKAAVNKLLKMLNEKESK